MPVPFVPIIISLFVIDLSSQIELRSFDAAGGSARPTKRINNVPNDR